MTSSVVVQAGIPALGTMLVIAAIALVLGLIALQLSRRHTRRETAEREAAERGAGERGPAGHQHEDARPDEVR